MRAELEPFHTPNGEVRRAAVRSVELPTRRYDGKSRCAESPLTRGTERHAYSPRPEIYRESATAGYKSINPQPNPPLSLCRKISPSHLILTAKQKIIRRSTKPRGRLLPSKIRDVNFIAMSPSSLRCVQGRR